MTEAARLEAFMAQRKRLLRLAYRHLGSAAEAEDIAQEAWLRFSRVAAVDDAARLLSRIVTRLCIDRATSARARRETYVGPWLPEPATEPFCEADSDSALDISFAVMRTLERLTPAERAAFFLHDLWDMPFGEIAQTLSKSPETCRKLASRARQRLAAERARFHPGPDEVARFVETFRTSVEMANPEALKALLADDIELVSDGGGKVAAARNVLLGPEAVSRFLVGLAVKNADVTVTSEPRTINDQLALLVSLDGVVDHVFAFDLDAAGRVAAIYIVRNPDKLVALTGA